MLRFRPATPEDAGAVAALAAASLRDVMPAPDAPETAPFWASIDATSQAHYIGSPRYRYLLALADGELAGLIAMRDTSHLFHLFVARRHQGQGLATTLWTTARDAARTAGHAGPFTVNAAPSAIPVYERFGFRKTGALVKAHGIVFQPMTID